LAIEVYNLLYNIRHKFENNVKLTKSLNMQLQFDFSSDKQHAIIELASMIGDITNILNFELKNQCIKESQVTELQHQLADARKDYDSRIEEQERLRKQELAELQGNFERKYQRFKEFQADIEKINCELQAQNEHIRGQFAHKETVIQTVELQNQQLEQQVTQLVVDQRSLVRALA
jgi:hypothetical protein